MKSHPRDSSLRQALGPVSDQTRAIRRHLAGCPACRERLSGMAFSSVSPKRVARLYAYEAALDRAFQKLSCRETVLRNERIEAPQRLREILGSPRQRQKLLLNNSRRFSTWGLFELALSRGEADTIKDPQSAENSLFLALEISDHLSPTSYGEGLIEDMRARAWGYIANVRRVRQDLSGSNQAFTEAFLHLGRGTEDPLEHAVLLDLEASLRRVETRFEDSIRLSGKALHIYQELGESHWVGRSLVKMAIAHAYKGDPHFAISLLHRALPLIDRAQEPQIALSALNNLADNLATTERFMEAQRVLLQSRRLNRLFPEPLIQGPCLWVESKVAEGLGKRVEAAELLSAARACFVASRYAEEAGLITQRLEHLNVAVDTRSGPEPTSTAPEIPLHGTYMERQPPRS